MIFNDNLSRVKLLSMPLKANNKNIKIAVYRNQSFELVANVLNTFLDFSDLNAEFSYGMYDDSLSFSENNVIKSDLNLIWLDLNRYKDINFTTWIKERINSLRQYSNSKILVYVIGETDFSNINIPDVLFVTSKNIESICQDKFFDVERQKFTGTRLSNKALLLVAKEIGLIYIPALFKQNLKAIVIDLDNTLYKGVLGEDGINGIIPNKNLINYLLNLKDKGFLLGILSKNEFSDVESLFKNRSDIGINLDDFTYEVNWKPKSENIEVLLNKWNIGVDSVLFIDDNIGELEAMRLLHPGVHTIEAKSEEYTLNCLKYYPGLFKSNLLKEDTIRSKDIDANKLRANLAKTLDIEEYFKKLEINLIFEINPINNIKRVSELLNKTNQFILSYVRYSETQLKEFLRKPTNKILSISMSDKLSDSGTICIILAHKDMNSILVIDEIVISCRALGRNIENDMLEQAFSILGRDLNTIENMKISYQIGERNMPGLNWLKSFSKKTDMDLKKNEVIQTKFDINFKIKNVSVKIFNSDKL